MRDVPLSSVARRLLLAGRGWSDGQCGGSRGGFGRRGRRGGREWGAAGFALVQLLATGLAEFERPAGGGCAADDALADVGGEHHVRALATQPRQGRRRRHAKHRGEDRYKYATHVTHLLVSTQGGDESSITICRRRASRRLLCGWRGISLTAPMGGA